MRPSALKYTILFCLPFILRAEMIYAIQPSGKMLAGAVASSDFIQVKTDSEGKTNFQAGYDQDHLFIKVTCREPEPSEIKAEVKQDWGPVWKDDCVEVFLSLRKGYIQLAANMLGKRFYSVQKTSEIIPDAKQWTVKTIVTKNEYVLIFTIPFGMLGLAAPASGEYLVLSGNICRERRAGARYELSSWQAARNFHDTSKFGLFIIGNADRWKKDLFEKYLKNVSEKLLELDKHTGTAADLRARLSEVKKEYAAIKRLRGRHENHHDLHCYYQYVLTFTDKIEDLMYKIKIEELFQ